MSAHLITGFAGKPHISSDDVGALHAGVIGPGNYVLDTRQGLKASMSSANTCLIAPGDLLMGGRHVAFPDATAVTIQSGTQGMRRADMVVCRYTKASNGVETAALTALKGQPASGASADPVWNKGSIPDGATIADMPLYRIPLDGISVGQPVPLYDKLPSMWDSLTRTPAPVVLISSKWGTVTGARAGRMVHLTINWKSAAGGSWESGAIGVLPEGWRPVMDVAAAYQGRDGGSQRQILIQSDGTATYQNMGATQNTGGFIATVCYLSA